MINRKLDYILILVLLIALFLQATLSMRQKSPTCDEAAHHIAVGYSFLKTGDFRLNSTGPPLIQELAAIPLLFMKLKLPLDRPSWINIDRTAFSKEFLYGYNKNSDEIVFFSRLVIVFLSILLGVLIYNFSSKLYGPKGGIFSLFLYSFCPNILAYSGLATQDLGVSLFMTLAIFMLIRYVKRPSLRNLILAGITFGLAQISKFTALILYPLFVVYLALAVFKKYLTLKKALGALLVIFILGNLTVWAGYFFEVKPLLKNDIDVPEKINYIHKAVNFIFPNGNENLEKSLVKFALNTPIPGGTYIMCMLANINQVFFKKIFTIFLMGQYSNQGFWHYYPLAFLIKTPLPLILFLITAILYFRQGKSREPTGEAFVILFIISFTFVSFFSRLQLGIRYILPLYPFLYIFVGRISLIKFKKVGIFAVTVLCLWYAIGTFRIYPHYIAYFNETIGGPKNGYKFLRDSSLDYGQDLKGLAKYLKKNNIKNVKLAYFGVADPAYYNISYEDIGKEEASVPKNEVYAVSVSCLGGLRWTKYFSPQTTIGYSIFIYDFRNINNLEGK